jgi:replicative DNA helicase
MSDVEQLVGLLRETAPPAAASAAVDAPEAGIPGGEFVFAEPEEIPALWGEGARVLWARGEVLMVCGPDGVGKSTLAQQILLAGLEIRPPTLLGLPLEPFGGHAAYLALDRPRQAARSLRRMVREEDRETLNERLTVWRGPLPFDLIQEKPGVLAAFAQHLGASVLVVDSLKDLALDLSTDETGGRVNLALQELVAAGIETCVLHHQRKAQPGASAPRRIADVYGSRWLTAGVGSVVLLWGEAGDHVVELRHLKQPGEEFGPHTILHDHVRGTTTLEADRLDFERLLAHASYGLTVADATRLAYDTDGSKPERNLIEKARRRLEGLVGEGKAERRDDPDGLARYFVREGA